MFYEYSQNNSFGTFDLGMGYRTIIEAEDNLQADEIAQDHGIYFDGCEDKVDCPCCGDRWSRSWSEEGTDSPMSYGKEVEKTTSEYFGFPPGRQIRIIKSGGIIEWL